MSETAGDPQAPSAPWYAAGLAFTCQEGCTACCSGEAGYVWVTTEEREAFARHLGLDRETFERRFARRIGTRWSLIEKRNGDCVFLDRARGCTVYEVRPRQCRTFPFWPENVRSPEAWAETARECPGCNTGCVHPAEVIAERAASSSAGAFAERIFERLRQLYEAVDREIAATGAGCAHDRTCCTLPADGSPRRVTTLEVELLVAGRRWRKQPLIAAAARGELGAAACPFRQGDTCTALEARPLACRTGGCTPQGALAEVQAAAERQRDSFESLFGIVLEHGELRELLARRG